LISWSCKTSLDISKRKHFLKNNSYLLDESVDIVWKINQKGILNKSRKENYPGDICNVDNNLGFNFMYYA